MYTEVVIGLGNPLFGDEGIGVRLVEALAADPELSVAGKTHFVDLGTAATRVLHAIAGKDKAILLDCAFMGLEPGEIRRFNPADVRTQKQIVNFSLHEGDLLATLALAARLGECPPEVVIFGIQPASIVHSLSLSPVLANRFNEYVSRIKAEILSAR